MVSPGTNETPAYTRLEEFCKVNFATLAPLGMGLASFHIVTAMTNTTFAVFVLVLLEGLDILCAAYPVVEGIYLPCLMRQSRMTSTFCFSCCEGV